MPVKLSSPSAPLPPNVSPSLLQKENTVYLHSELVFSLKEGNPASGDNMLDRGQHAKRNKLDTSKQQQQNDLTYMWNLK